MREDPNTGPTSPQAVWPDPARVKQLTELAREPTAGKPISDYFPGIDPSDPSYELATNLLKDHPHAIQALSIALRNAQRGRTSSSPRPTRPEAAEAKITRKLGSVQSPGAPDQQSSVLYEAAQRMNLTRQATATAALTGTNPTPSVIETLIQQTAAARSVREQPQETVIDTLAQQARASAAQTDWAEQLAEQGIAGKLAQIAVALLISHHVVAKAMQASTAKAQGAAKQVKPGPVGLSDRQVIERAVKSPLTIADYRQVSVRTKVATGAIIAAMAKSPVSTSPVVSARESMENTRLLFEALDRVESVWAEDGLWFVFSRLTHTSVFLFETLTQREQIEAAALDALERVCQHGLFIEVMCNAIDLAPHMTGYQREIITHALGHMQRGEYRLAIAPLMNGLEGAIEGMAISQSVIDNDRWIVGQPRIRKNHLHNVDAIIKLMPLDDEYARFLHRYVFGKCGNPIRHGNMQGDERERALLLVVALAGWMDNVMKIPASTTLANAMSGYLPETVSRQHQLAA